MEAAETANDPCFEKVIRQNTGELGVDLFGEHIAAEGNAALQGDGREIGALAALGIRPGAKRGRESRERGTQHVQHAEIRADGLDSGTILWAIRAEVEELQNAGKVIAAGGLGDASNVLNLQRQRFLRGGGDQRTAIGDEKLQQKRHRAYQDDSGHHRDTHARRAGEISWSEESFQKAYAQASGRTNPMGWIKERKRELLAGNMLRSA